MVKTKHHSEIHIQLFFVFRFELSMVHFVIFSIDVRVFMSHCCPAAVSQE